MSRIRAALSNVVNVQIDVTITATVAEWNDLHNFIKERRHEVSSDHLTPEPFWSLIYRLGDVLADVQKHHTSYE